MNIRVALILSFLLTVFLPVFAADPVEQQLKKAADLYFSGKPKEALEDYIQISKQSHPKDSFLNAAFITLEQGKPKEAVDILNAALKFYPDDDTLREFTADAYLADGQFLNAEKLLSTIVNEKRGEFYNINLARAQMGMGENNLAKHNLQTAAAGKSLVSLSNYFLGLIYEQEKNYLEAAAAYKKAVNYDHQFAEARLHYAASLEKLGDYDEAWKQYRMLRASEKSLPEIGKAIERLRPKLSQKPEEIEKGKKIKTHTFVKPVLSLDGKLETIRVGLGARGNGAPSIRTSLTFSPSHFFRVIDTQTGKTLATGKGKEEWTVVLKNKKAYVQDPKGKKHPFAKSIKITQQNPSPNEGHTIIIKSVLSGAGMTWVSIDDKEYRGVLEVIYNTRLNALVPVNHINMEEYVMGVMSSEMPSGFPLNALRSQAVLARTYALQKKGKHKSYGYDVCDTQHCQVYGGVSSESEPGNAAVESTMGQVLLYKNRPIESVFSANCGGFTQSAKEAGWFETAYLKPVSDYKDFDFEKLQPYHFADLLRHPHEAYSRYDKHVSPAAYRWARVVEVDELQQIIKKQKRDIGEITAIIPLQRSRSGYVGKLTVQGTKDTITLDKENVIRRNLSLGMLRSSYFIVQPNYQNRKLKNFIFYGGGWGHGVGFCQTGSAGRAEAGQDYKTILKHYFPLANLKDIRTK